jgi:O-antigen/teichoic acid export membrane protein
VSLARHTVYNLTGFLAPLAVSLVTVPLYLRYVGLERYGLLAICWTLLGFMSFLSLGMGPAVTQRLAAEPEASAAHSSQVFWNAALLSFAMACIGALAILIFGRAYFETVRLANSELRGEIQQALPWLSLAFLVSLSTGVLNGALQGRQWFGLLNVVGIATASAGAILPLAVAIAWGPNLPTLVAATLIVYLCSFAVQLDACRRAVPLVGTPRFSASIIRRLSSFGGWMTIVSLLSPVLELSDRLIIGSRLGSATVPIYVIPYNLASRTLALPVSLSSAALPRLAAVDVDESERLGAVALRFLLVCLTPICVAGNLLMGPFLHFWVGDQIAKPATQVGCLLVFGFWMHGVGHIPSTVLLGRGRPEIIAKLLLIYIVPYFALLLICIHFFGIAGAALAWALRSSANLSLFAFAKVSRADAVVIAACATLVLSSSLLSVLLDWHRGLFWLVLLPVALLAAIASWCFAPRELISWVGFWKSRVLPGARA